MLVLIHLSSLAGQVLLGACFVNVCVSEAGYYIMGARGGT